MEPDALIEVMKGYFVQRKFPAETFENFAEKQPRELLKESLDVVEFVVHLEEELGQEIDTNELGEALLNKSFGDLAVEIIEALKAQEGASEE